MQGWRRIMDICLPLTLTGPTLPEGHTSYFSPLPLYLFIKPIFIPVTRIQTGSYVTEGEMGPVSQQGERQDSYTMASN